MPIDRNGKHWCAPAGESPDGAGLWSCTCGTVWHFDPSWQVWEPVPADPVPADPDPVPAEPGGAE